MKSILKNKKGLTLLEILVTIGILSLIIMPLMGMFLSAYKSTVASQRIMSGTYITQSILENCKTMGYTELTGISGSMLPYDSNGDGENDCYIKVEVYPEGVAGNLAPSEKTTLLHITYIATYHEDTDSTIDMVHILGDDGSYASFPAQAGASYTLNWGGGNRIEFTNDVSGELLASFITKSAEYPLCIIANIRLKTFGYSNTLAISSTVKSRYNTTIAEYASQANISEFICSDLLETNRMFGVNDYSTALVHLKITAFYDSTGASRIGELEETVTVKIR